MEAITFSLPSSLDISIVKETKEAMVEQLYCEVSVTHVNIDAGDLSRIDTAGYSC
jgi:hypothetical protein